MDAIRWKHWLAAYRLLAFADLSALYGIFIRHDAAERGIVADSIGYLEPRDVSFRYLFTVDSPLSKRYVNKESGWTINMAITLNLRPEVEAGLIAQAQANGMTLEEYLLSMVEGAALTSSRTISSEEHKQMSTREAAVQRMLEFGEKYHLSLGEPVTRTLLHQGHRF